MDRLNVLMIYDYLPPVEGGIENHVYYLISNLKMHNIFLLTLRFSELLSAYEEIDNARIFRIAYKRLTPLRYVFHGIKVISKNKIQLIHAHTLGTPAIVALLLGVLFRIPVILTIHESQFIINMTKKRFFPRIIYSILINLSEAIITTSDEIRKYAMQLAKKPCKIVEVANGVDFNLFDYRMSVSCYLDHSLDKSEIVLCPRRITPKNGIIYLVEAIPKIIKNRDKTRFLFVGPISDQKYFNLINERIRKLGIEKNVLFTGGVPHNKMPDYYARAYVVVIPSLIEAVSLSALEAMASKKVVVASCVGGLKELFKTGFNGLLVNPGDSNALADAVVFLLENRPLALAYAEKAYLGLNQFSWENVALKTSQIYISSAKK